MIQTIREAISEWAIKKNGKLVGGGGRHNLGDSYYYQIVLHFIFPEGNMFFDLPVNGYCGTYESIHSILENKYKAFIMKAALK